MKKIFTCILTVVAFAPFLGKAQKGTLDPSFGTGGIARADFLGENLNFNQAGWKTLPAADGKSYLIIDVNGQAVITRRLSNGSLDATYGTNGYSVPADNMRPVTGAVQNDGKIIVAGTLDGSSIGFKLVRFNPNGSLDVSFGNNGIVQTLFPYPGSAFTFGTAHSIAVQGDGKILAAGFASISSSGSNAFAITRYNPDGSLDATFGTNGKVQTPFFYDGTNSSAGVTSILLLADGKFIATGHADAGSRNFGFALARYTAGGVLDPSFGTGGKVQTPFPYDGVNSMALSMSSALQSDGKIVMAGYYDGDALFPTTERGFALARYNADGSLDATFDGDGKVKTPFFFDATQSAAVAYSMVIQSDGKIVAAGVANVQQYSPAFAVTRYNPDGTLDASFGSNGKAQTSFPYPSNDGQTYANAFSAALQSDGKILAAGSANSGYGSAYALVRYNLDGSLDASFDGDGKVVDSLRTGSTLLNTTAVQSDGKILSAGSYQMSLSNDKGFAVARFNPNGTLDATFGDNGKVQTPFYYPTVYGNFSSAIAQALAIQSDGKIIAGGESHTGSGNFGFALARYNSNGSPDATFGNNGKVETIFPTESYSYSRSYLYALAVQSDGKILAAGTSDYLNNYSNFAIARYKTDGSLDSTFGTNGLVKTHFGSASISVIKSLAVQADGKIIAAGSSKPGTNYAFTLVRYNQDGSLDASFSTDGIEQTDFGSNSGSAITSIILQSDGKILAAGSLAATTTNRLFIVARYNSDGSLDASFNGNGKAQTSFLYDGTTSAAIVQSIIVHGDGKIAATGYAFTGSSYAVALARYNPDGSPDLSLGENGKVMGVSNVPIAGMTITSTKVYSAGSIKHYGYLGAVAAFKYNEAPILAAIGNKKASAGGVLSFKANGTDADIPVQSLSYSISFLPNGATFNQTTGEFSWTPSANQSGDYITTFSVTDGIATDEETITITVNKPSPRLAPVIETYAPHSGPVGTLVTLTGTGFTDITGVTFNGMPATYTVIDSTTITTTVPQGATTGKISVSNANGTAYSRGKFTVPGTGPGNNRTVLASVAESKEVKATPIMLSVKALPNPAPDYFTLVIQSSNSEPISINVRDASGRLMERRNIETPRTMRIGNQYRAGVYYAEVMQGRERVTIKLVKL